MEHFGIVPDITTMSKSLTNGLAPLSLVWARDELVSPDVFTPGHAHSNFANYSLGTSAALATWRYMMGQSYERRLEEKSARYLDGLRRMKHKYSFIHHVDGLGMLFNMSFADHAGKPFENAGKYAVTLAQDETYLHKGETFRMILNSGGYWSEGLKLAPYLDITTAEIDRTLDVLDQVLEKLGRKLERMA